MKASRRTDLIDTDAGVRELARAMGSAKQIGLDTEFVGERTYLPQLELLQISYGEETAVVDCRAVPDLAPILEILLNRKVEKVVHAGQQDLELLFHVAGDVPVPIFDTQVAAAMVGHGAQPGYAALVERLLRTRISKSETLTDWSRRPLSPAQIAYAHEDVRYLMPLRSRLGEKLAALGRDDWLREELRRLEDAEAYRRPDPRRSYLRVRGRGGLHARALAILRELAVWREEEAQRRNKPRSSVLSDDLLVEIARRAPQEVDELKNFRGQFARAVERHAPAIVETVARALSLSPSEWPQPPPPSNLPPPNAGVVELLQAVLRVRAEESHIAPTLVATSADLHALVETHFAGAKTELPLLSGWRHRIAGADLVALLHGEANLRVDPKSGKVEVIRRKRDD